MDLLNKIFVVDDKKRITIEAIKEHPWYGPALCCPHQSTFPFLSGGGDNTGHGRHCQTLLNNTHHLVIAL